MKTKGDEKYAELEAQIKVTEQSHNAFNEDNENLKDIFKECFQENIVVSFMNFLNKSGGIADKKYAKEFKKAYDGDNFDDVNIKWFKKTFQRYNEEFMKELNKEDEE